ncbi:hypothetical protein BKA63DRAFT_174048 [Paraphoma chrysanthemicola]|nr:hypothetical protein BKA63DRAFT_174048 [Paraphoma chrysanthemicola]
MRPHHHSRSIIKPIPPPSTPPSSSSDNVSFTIPLSVFSPQPNHPPLPSPSPSSASWSDMTTITFSIFSSINTPTHPPTLTSTLQSRTPPPRIISTLHTVPMGNMSNIGTSHSTTLATLSILPSTESQLPSVTNEGASELSSGAVAGITAGGVMVGVFGIVAVLGYVYWLEKKRGRERVDLSSGA